MTNGHTFLWGGENVPEYRVGVVAWLYECTKEITELYPSKGELYSL